MSYLDPEIEEQLDRWVEAKRAKDFRTADAIRKDLRSQGVDPDTRRPSNNHNQQLVPKYGSEIEARLDDWVEAKRAKDFAKADAIREELRYMGVEPDAVRPMNSHSSGGSRGQQSSGYDSFGSSRGQQSSGYDSFGGSRGQQATGYDHATERRLDEWVAAKRNKDFERADQIRQELRSRGVEPDSARAKHGDCSAFSSAPQMQPVQMLQPVVQPVQLLVPAPSVQPIMGVKKYNSTTESKIDEWVEARRSKDFGRADLIREELRMMGVEPDPISRPHAPQTGAPMGMLTNDPDVEAQLDAWVTAKRSKDFERADSIRDRLRARGIDPDVVRPANGQAPPPVQAAAVPMMQPVMPGPPPMAEYVPKKKIVPKGCFDAETEKRLDEWVAAKRAKDFSLADYIRDELRAQGVEPDCARPSDRQDQLFQEQMSRGVTPAIAQPLDPATEAQLDQWVMAKRCKDYDKADAIRDRLRARGIEPDSLRPSHKHDRASEQPSHSAAAGMTPMVPLMMPSGHDPGIEAQLDAWVAAKRMKDFDRADSIRDRLRAKGIDPDTARPANGAAPEPQMAYIMPQHPAVQQVQQPPQVQYLMPASQVAAAQQSAPPVAAEPLTSPAMVSPSPSSRSTPSHPRKYDEATEARLDEWVAAKRLKDFASADIIRQDLRAQGVDPDTARPAGRARDTSNFEMAVTPVPSAAAAARHYDGVTEAKLDEWVTAKRNKDFDKADEIRAELRSHGVEPDFARPGKPDTGLGYALPSPQQPMMMVLPQPQMQTGQVQYIMPAPQQSMMLMDSGQAQPMMMAVSQASATAAVAAAMQPITQVQQRWKHVREPFSAIDQLQAQAAAPPAKVSRSSQSSYATEQYHSGSGSRSGSGSGSGSNPDNPFHYDDYTESQLDRWIAAKRAKDFATADAIRSELRARGIDPDIARPPDRR